VPTADIEKRFGNLLASALDSSDVNGEQITALRALKKFLKDEGKHACDFRLDGDWKSDEIKQLNEEARQAARQIKTRDKRIQELEEALAVAEAKARATAPPSPPEANVPPVSRTGDNAIRASSDADLFTQAQKLARDAEREIGNATAKSGIPLGRVAIELTRRWKENHTGKRLTGDTLSVYLVRGIKTGITTINRWATAAAIVDDPDAPWAEVEAYCVAAQWATPEVGVAKIKAMRKFWDEDHAP
jgi:hypothetical protein